MNCLTFLEDYTPYQILTWPNKFGEPCRINKIGLELGVGMGRVDPPGLWPDPDNQGRWGNWAGLIRKLGRWIRHRATHRVSRVDPGV